MATDFLGVDIRAKTFPFTQPASFNATRYSTVPWGQALINESFDTPAIAAGNDGLINIDIGLPADYVAIIRNLYLAVVDTSGVFWNKAMLGIAYQQPGGPYKDTIASYPEQDYSWYQMIGDRTATKDRFATDQHYSTFTFGFQNVDNFWAFDNSWSPTQLPIWVSPSADSFFNDRTLILNIENDLQSQPTQRCTLRASFDLYTFEQAYSAAVMSSPRVFS